jgi:hypothetical protein
MIENAEIQQLILQIPVVDVQKHRGDIAKHLERTYGKDWRQRPLLLRHLWTSDELGDPSRKLSLKGLLQLNMSIPYFSDARLPNALAPDAVGAVSSIVANISEKGMPHKIASQFVIQALPDLINEVKRLLLLSLATTSLRGPCKVRDRFASFRLLPQCLYLWLGNDPLQKRIQWRRL